MTFSVLVDGDAQRDLEEIVAWFDAFAVLHHHRGPDALSSRL